MSAVLPLSAATVGAATTFTTRFSTNAQGDITVVANTILTCPSSSSCTSAQNGAASDNNGFSMVFVDVDGDPSTFNSSSADLALPAGAEVLFAGLYWGADLSAGSGGSAAPNAAAYQNALLRVPGSGAYSTVTSTSTDPVSNNAYTAFADVTAQVKAAGSGTYTLANVQSGRGLGRYGGWAILVAYRLQSLPLRRLLITDGFVRTYGNSTATINISGLITPPTGTVTGEIIVVSYEGDRSVTPGKREAVTLNGQLVGNSLNPTDNLFNSSITSRNVRISTKNPNYDNQLGFDADILSIDGLIPNNATSATLQVISEDDGVVTNVLAFVTDLLAPDLQVTKTATDQTGGAPLRPGDEVEYTVTVRNAGGDIATAATLTDAIPAGMSYVPGSLQIVSGANAGAKTDATDGDQARFDAGRQEIVVHLGSGAGASAGGTLAINDETSVVFRTRVAGSVANGATIRNTGTVSGTGSRSGATVSESGSVDVTVVNQADLRVTKSVSNASPNIGDSVTYTIEAVNNGPSPVTGATLSDVFPSKITGVTWTCTGSTGGSCATASGSGSVTDAVNLPVGGRVTVTATGMIAATAVGSITNTATIAAPSGVTLVSPSAASASATITVPESPLIGLAKRAVSIADNGDGSSNVVFEVTAANLGNADLISVVISDDLASTFGTAAGFTVDAAAFVGGSGITANPAFNGRTDIRVATISKLDVGASAAIRFGVRVQRGGNNGPYSNFASVTAQTSGGASTNDRSTTGSNPDPDGNGRPTEQQATQVLFTPSADLDVTVLSASPTPAFVGQDLTYTVTVTNHGPSQATGVILDQDFGTAVTFVSAGPASGGCTNTATEVICGLGTLNSGASQTVTIVVRPTATGNLDATASTSSAVPDPVTSNNQRQLQTPVRPSADLSLTKTVAPGGPLVGQNITSTLTITNNGPSPATNVVVTDQLLGPVRFVSATPGGCTASGTTVTCNLGALAVGVPTVVTTTFTVEGTGPITDVGAVSAAENDPDASNNGRTATVLAAASADLSLTKNASAANVFVGQQITYTLTVNNAGPSPASGVTVQDLLPSRVTLNSATPSQGTCAGSSTVTCSLGTINSGGSATVTIVVTATTAGTLGNLATVQSPTPDPNAANNSAQAVSTATGQANLGISLVPSAGAVPEGSVVTFTATIDNAGPQTSTLTRVRIVVPAATGLTASTPSGVCSVSGAIIDCDLDPLAPAGTTTVSVQAQAGTPGLLLAGAAVRAFEVDPNPANNLAFASVSVGAAAGLPVDVQLTKTGPGALVGGANAAYVLTVSNPSINTANNVVVDDVLPNGFALVSATPSQGSCTEVQPGQIQCALGTIAGLGGAATINIVAQANAAGVQVNTATVSSTEPDTNGANNLAQVTTDVSSNADLTVTVTPTPATINLGNQGSFVITVTNNGPTGASGVELSSLLAGVQFDVVSVTPSQGTCSTGSPITCQLGAIANGANATVTVVGQPRAVGSVQASAAVTSASNDPNPSNNVDDGTLTVNASADLTVTATVSPDPLPVTGNLTYRVTVTNQGPSPATNVVLLGALDRAAGLVSVTSSQGACRPIAGLLLCDIGSLAVGATVNLTIVVREDQLGVLVGGVAVAGSEPDPNQANNSAVLAVRVVQASVVGTDLRLTKTASTATPTYGDEIRFTLTVRNRGTMPATSVTLTDTLPAELQFVSATPSQGSCAGGQTITCTLGTIASSGEATVEVVTRTASSGTVTNTARVQAAETEADNTDNVASATVQIGGGDTNKPNNDDEDDKPKETEEERRQREQTNRGGIDDDRTEGNVVAVRCADGPVPDAVGWMDDGADAPYAVIANRDGLQKVRLIGEARTTCRSIKIGQYLEADGVKQTEQLFDAENVTVRK